MPIFLRNVIKQFNWVKFKLILDLPRRIKFLLWITIENLRAECGGSEGSEQDSFTSTTKNWKNAKMCFWWANKISIPDYFKDNRIRLVVVVDFAISLTKKSLTLMQVDLPFILDNVSILPRNEVPTSIHMQRDVSCKGDMSVHIFQDGQK